MDLKRYGGTDSEGRILPPERRENTVENLGSLEARLAAAEAERDRLAARVAMLEGAVEGAVLVLEAAGYPETVAAMERALHPQQEPSDD